MTWTSGPCEPMTDETTARDRAAAEAVLTEAVRYWTEDPDRCDMQGYEDAVAAHLLDALLAHPEVLRALAGAPTADVAAIEWGAKWSDGGYCPSNPPRSEEFARQHARNFGTRPIRRAVGPWLYDDTGEFVFADERAPTADVAALMAIAETARRMYAATDAGDRQDAAYASRTLRDLLAAAPEGVDAADERRQLVDLVKLGEEKQRLLADQLAAAQAAIARVRKVADELDRKGEETSAPFWPRAEEMHRAAKQIRHAIDDGDTAEEEAAIPGPFSGVSLDQDPVYGDEGQDR